MHLYAKWRIPSWTAHLNALCMLLSRKCVLQSFRTCFIRKCPTHPRMGLHRRPIKTGRRVYMGSFNLWLSMLGRNWAPSRTLVPLFLLGKNDWKRRRRNGKRKRVFSWNAQCEMYTRFAGLASVISDLRFTLKSSIREGERHPFCSVDLHLHPPPRNDHWSLASLPQQVLTLFCVSLLLPFV